MGALSERLGTGYRGIDTVSITMFYYAVITLHYIFID